MVGIYVIVLAWFLGVLQLAWLRAWRGAAVCTWFGVGFFDIVGLASLGFVPRSPEPGMREIPSLGMDPQRVMWALAAGVALYVLGLVLLVTSGRRGLRCVQACAVVLGLGWLALEVMDPGRLGMSLVAVLAFAGAHFAIAVFAEFARPEPPAPPGPAYSDTFD